MHRRWSRSTLTLLALAALTVTGCEPERTPTSPRYECRARFVTPYHPVVASARRITGEAGFACRTPPAAHHAALYLELQQPSGAWQVKDETTSTQIPTATGFTLRVLDDCRIGLWRLRMQTQATAGGKIDRGSDYSSFLRIRTNGQCDKVER